MCQVWEYTFLETDETYVGKMVHDEERRRKREKKPPWNIVVMMFSVHLQGLEK